MPDEDVIRAVLQGDIEKYGFLMARHQHRVFSVSYGILRDYGLAEDATQEIFFKAYQSLDSFHGSASFSTWLHRITVNYCMTVLRRTRDILSFERNPESVAYDTPEHLVVQSETMMDIEQAISRLSPDARAVITLRLHSELRFSEIGEVLGISEDLAKVRFHRAKLQLQNMLTQAGLSPANRKERVQ